MFQARSKTVWSTSSSWFFLHELRTKDSFRQQMTSRLTHLLHELRFKFERTVYVTYPSWFIWEQPSWLAYRRKYTNCYTQDCCAVVTMLIAAGNTSLIIYIPHQGRPPLSFGLYNTATTSLHLCTPSDDPSLYLTGKRTKRQEGGTQSIPLKPTTRISQSATRHLASPPHRCVHLSNEVCVALNTYAKRTAS